MIAVTGAGLWAPGYASVEAFRSGVRDEAVREPACAIADARAKRGTSRLMRMLGEVVHQAATEGGAQLATASTVYASAWGEIDTMVRLLEQIFDGEVGLSPIRFKVSVHNAASGMVSIASENRGFSTALAAGRRSFEMGLIEAWGLLERTSGDVILAVGDDELPAPLDRFARYEGLAVALCLTREPGGRAPLAWLGPPTAAVAAAAPLPERWAANPAAWALPLLEAIAARDRATVPLSAAARPFAVEVRPGAGS